MNNIALKSAIVSEIIAILDAAKERRHQTTEERQFRAALKVQRLGPRHAGKDNLAAMFKDSVDQGRRQQYPFLPL